MVVLTQLLENTKKTKEVKPLTNEDYFTSGCTALIDSIGYSIEHIMNIYKYIRKQDIPNRTTFMIVTDGQENASHIYNSDQVKNMIAQQKEKSWEFIFLGANIDAEDTAKKLNIEASRAVNYVDDSKGLKKAHKFMDKVADILYNGENNDEIC